LLHSMNQPHSFRYTKWLRWIKNSLHCPIQKPAITFRVQPSGVQCLLQFPGMDSGSIAGKQEFQRLTWSELPATCLQLQCGTGGRRQGFVSIQVSTQPLTDD